MRFHPTGLRPAFFALALPLSAQVPVGQLSTPRCEFACAALPTGLLITGGRVADEGTGHPCASTERLDLLSGSTQPLAPMLGSRSGHALVRLLDGSLLALGGEGQVNATPGPNPGIVPPIYGPLPTAERYLPLEGRWESVGSMARSRQEVAASLTPDGRVLVVGEGRETEWYHPVMRTFTPGPMLFQNHPDPLVLPLPGGRLLILGTGLARPELIDPSSGRVRLLPSLRRLRTSRFTATAMPDGGVIVAGGDADTSRGATVERLDPLTLAFHLLPLVLGTDRREHSATALPDGRLLLAGGRGVINRVPDGSVGAVPPVDGYLGTVEVIDPLRATAVQAGFLGTPRARHAAKLTPEGSLLVIGGLGDEGLLGSVEKVPLD